MSPPVRVDKARYTSPAFLRREWQHVFRKVWLLAAHVSELPEPGSHLTLELGDEPLLLWRGDDGRERTFANVCMHRGHVLCPAREGRASELRCAYHHFTYDTEGRLTRAPRARVELGGVRLAEVRCQRFGGFLWVHLGHDEPEPLEHFLAPIAGELLAYELDAFALVHATTVAIDCNWKASVDASNEAFHLRTLHPELMCLVDDEAITIEPRGPHGAIRVPLAGPARGTPFEGRVSPELVSLLAGLGAHGFDGTLGDVGPSIARGHAERALREGVSLGRLPPEALAEKRQLFVFPNVQLNLTPFDLELYRHRPHATDPERTLFDEHRYARVTQARPRAARPPRREGRHGELDLGPVMGADVDLLPRLTRGMRSSGFRELLLTPAEAPIAHLHRVLDDYLARGEQVGP
jgi:nitrite reductase/ring-hydroxylating ferredoxin subunit